MPPTVFADTFYWLALARPRDPWHVAVRQWAASNATTCIVTSDEVLTEFLNAVSRAGSVGRIYAATTVHSIRSAPQINVLPQSRQTFDSALAIYEARPDKEYSLTDCRTMAALNALGITEVLTHDRHFTQEGFTILFP